MWAVFKLGEDGRPTGDPLGVHESEEQANEQVAALYAAEEDDKAETKAGRVLSKRNYERVMTAMQLLHEALSEAGLMEEEDESAEEEMADESKAGPDEPPTAADNTAEMLKEIDLQLIDLMEVQP